VDLRFDLQNSPAVFVFDPSTGHLASQNASAGELMEMFGLTFEAPPTLSAVERLIVDGSKVIVDPQHVTGESERSYELRKRCRRPDSSEFILTRVWAPGSSTALIVADITRQVQEERQLRLAQVIIDKLMKSDSLGDALDRFLYAIGLYAGWGYGEAWLVREDSLVLKRHWRRRQKPLRVKAGDMKDIACRARSGGVLCRGEGAAAIPLKANGEVIAVVAFRLGRPTPRDELTFEVLEAVADRLGMALQCRIHVEEMTNARRQLDELLAAAGDAIVAMDGEQTIRIFNRQAELIFGYEAEEVIGRKLDMLLPDNVRMRHRTQVARFARDDTPTRLMGRRPEVKGRRKDGSEFPAEASISRVVMDGETIFTAVVRDLTSLRQAEDALRARERQMRVIVEAMPFGLAIVRREDGGIVFCNSAFGVLVDMDATELAERHIADFLDKDLAERLTAAEAVDGRVDGIEAPLKERNGGDVWCVLSAVAMSMGGEEVALIGCYDVTDRRRAVEALRESAANLAGAERIAHLGNWQFDMLADEVSCSDETFRIFGHEPQGVKVTLPLFLASIHTADEPAIGAAVTAALESGTSFRETCRIVLADGEIRHIRVEAEVVRDAKGRVGRLIGTVLDITDLQKTAEELRAARNRAEQANKAKSQFLANMSHELRTPLNAIIGFSELMATDAIGPLDHSQYQAYAKDINDSGLHLLAIVNDILDLSRIEAGVTELEEAEIDLDELCAVCLRTVEGRARTAKLCLGVDLSAGLPPLWADPRLVKQILINLLSNAVKFTPPGGTVRLSAHLRSGNGLSLAVEDSGIGIAAEDLDRVIEPFMQVEGDLARRFEGVGLGLALCKRFAELHGATLAISSELGRGTRVDIHFPAARTLAARAIGVGA
jgi:PAS domain S-box-containing protein